MSVGEGRVDLDGTSVALEGSLDVLHLLECTLGFSLLQPGLDQFPLQLKDEVLCVPLVAFLQQTPQCQKTTPI